MTVKTKGIVVYVLLAFGLAWSCWLVLWLLGVPAASPIGGFAPALAAVIVRRWVTREGFQDAGLALHLKSRWPYYLLAWVLPLLVLAVVVGLATVLGQGQPDLSLQRGLSVLFPGRHLPTGVVCLGLLAGTLLLTPVLWGEEFGWRSYLQIRLLSQHPLLAALTTGLMFGIWHYPLLLMGGAQGETLWVALILFPVDSVLLSLIFGWLRLRTKSIWPASLAHAATHTLGIELSLLLFVGGGNLDLLSYNGLLVLIPLAAFCLWIILTGQLTATEAVRRGETSHVLTSEKRGACSFETSLSGKEPIMGVAGVTERLRSGGPTTVDRSSNSGTFEAEDAHAPEAQVSRSDE
ncbi:MAG: CPBP family intramembrane glutamic endopeptidase [Ktedonobacteraceae bacterium]